MLVKKSFKYILLFLVFLICLIVPYNMFFGDSIVNLGFSYAIRMGEIPYRDFNLVIPLFSPILYSLPLFIYKSSISFYIFQAILLVVLFRFLELKLKNKVYVFFALVFLSYPLVLSSALFPGYNFLVFLEIIILCYLEENNKNDYLIGFLIGLAIITKHVIGVFLIIPSVIFYYKKLYKIKKRLIGISIPVILFIIYLLITNTFSSFLNLTILGLFDFGKSNASNISILSFISLICFIYLIIKIKTNPKEKSYYYLIICILFSVPILDQYHLSYFILACLYVFINDLNINEKYIKLSVIMIPVLLSIWTIMILSIGDYKYKSYNNYPFRYMTKNMENNYLYLDSFIKKHNNTILFCLGTENYFYKITNNKRITYYDLPNYGNYGHNSFKMMKKKIDKEKNVYFIVNKKAYKSKNFNQQYYKELAKYIMHYELVEENSTYMILYKK